MITLTKREGVYHLKFFYILVEFEVGHFKESKILSFGLGDLYLLMNIVNVVEEDWLDTLLFALEGGREELEILTCIQISTSLHFSAFIDLISLIYSSLLLFSCLTSVKIDSL